MTPHDLPDGPATLDIAGLVLLTAATGLVRFAGGERTAWLAVLLGGLFVLWAPGYALVAALYPATTPAPSGKLGGIGLPRRLIYSVTASLALAPIAGLGLDLVRAPVRGATMFGVLAAGTVLCGLVALVRRGRQPPERRFDAIDALGRLAGSLKSTDLPLGRDLVSVVLVLAVVVGAGGVVYAAANPAAEGTYTSFSVVPGENGTAPERSVGGVPPGESLTTRLAVANHEGRAVTYTVVPVRQRVANGSDGYTVVESETLPRFDRRVPAGATWYRDHTVTTPETDRGVRVVYRLYAGEVTGEPYRTTARWLQTPPAPSASTGTPSR